MQTIVWPLRFLLFCAIALTVLLVERFALPPPPVPLRWDYWLFVCLLSLAIQMWANDSLAHLRIGATRAYELRYDGNTDRLIPLLPRLAFLYPVFCAMLCYALWYLRNFPLPLSHSPPA
jgi:hypothetical protein